MAYDETGRWVPSEDLTWTRNTEAQKQALINQLTEAGLDWSDGGKFAFRTDIWGAITEGERFDLLQQYDTWYDKGGQLSLNDEEWGLDIERGITYDEASTWNAQERFHYLTGGEPLNEESDKTWYDLTNPYKYADKVRGTLIEEVRDDDFKHVKTLYQTREFPMDWAGYTDDPLYRAAIDDVLEDDYNMFMGPGADFDNARQVRAAEAVHRKWKEDIYKQADREGRDQAWVAQELKQKLTDEIESARISNKRYPEGRNTRGFQHNQQVLIRKYKPFQKFDEETGTMSRYHPITGELRSKVTYQAPPLPTRMSITGNKAEEDVDAGQYYSPTFGYEQKITDSMMDEPAPISKPNLSIRKLGPLDNEGQGKARKPDNIKNWSDTGVVK